MSYFAKKLCTRYLESISFFSLNVTVIKQNFSKCYLTADWITTEKSLCLCMYSNVPSGWASNLLNFFSRKITTYFWTDLIWRRIFFSSFRLMFSHLRAQKWMKIKNKYCFPKANNFILYASTFATFIIQLHSSH